MRPRRAAVFSLHTSPLEQPGTGDAGGMNVYIAQTARRLAEFGTEVEILSPPSARQEMQRMLTAAAQLYAADAQS